MDGLKLIAAILETGSIETLRRASVDLFLDDERPIFDYVRRHYRRYAQLPAFNTVEEETGAQLPQCEETVDYYLRRVYNRKLYGDLTPAFSRLRDSLKDNDMDRARDVIGEMRAISREDQPDEDIRDLTQASRAVMTAYDEAKHSPGMTGVPSGWPTFDDRTGGYQNGDLVSWVGRMNMGKTYLLLKQAVEAWEAGFSVLVVTMEMTIPQITRRAAGLLAGINPEYIRKGTLSTYAERRLRECIDTLVHADRFNLYAGGFSKKIDDVEILMQEFDPDCTYIDSAYLLKPESKRQMHRLERIAEVTDALKQITIRQNRPLVQTSQLSRSAGKKGRDASLESIGFTDAIGMHSSLVVSIKEGRPPHQSSRRVLEFLKGREGEVGELEIGYQFAPVNFDEIPPEVQQAEAVDLDWMGQQQQ